MKKYWMGLFGVLLGIISLLVINLFKEGDLCEQYEKNFNSECEKVIFTDWENKISFLKSGNKIVSVHFDKKGRIDIPTLNLELGDLEKEKINWVSSSQYQILIGVANRDIKKIKMSSPQVYEPNIIHQNDYSIFYIPLDKKEHIYNVGIQGFDEKNELLYPQ